MFDIDKWQEILSTIKKNKLRTVLTGFAVAWGIFMLMVLLGAGNGLSNGVGSNFQGNAINAMWIWSRETSMPYEGFQSGRSIQMKMSDLEAIGEMDNVDKISAQYWIGDRTYAFENEYGSYNTQACHPDYKIVENYQLTTGRFLNEIDMQYGRKVMVIGTDIQEALFKKIDPVGKIIRVGDVPFKIIGVYSEFDPREGTRQGLIPITTAQKLFNSGERIHNIALTTHDISKKESIQVEKDIRNLLAENHKFNSEDERAVGIYNSLEDYVETMSIFSAINMFVWLIGIGTLIAGIVGVSNIMLIVVKERTKEIGIRKALGATPASIVGLVLLESILITALAGYIGMFFGISLMEGVNFLMEQQAQTSVAASGDQGEIRMFMNPTVDLRIAISAMMLLISAGALAGYIPARRAASVKPIEALHDE
ncbi:MAG: ABC transporter permease [Prolixibacteraceae bacterium]|nr:ABC transporter permease [Prolixibacteraceae bacterium]MBN2650201.1 ABC transporter permease [Prolixibacteraceae bacterium]